MTNQDDTMVSQWSCFEQKLTSTVAYAHPLHDAELIVTFTSPRGEARQVRGFWDGGMAWRVRFAPTAVGQWTYQTSCSDGDKRWSTRARGRIRVHCGR